MERRKRHRTQRPRRAAPPPTTGTPQRSSARRLMTASGTWVAAGAVLVLGGLLLYFVLGDRQTPAPSAGPTAPAPAAVRPAAQYVGSQVCTTCHAQAYEAWRSSHHAHAMQEAQAQTVLGDFHDARLTEAGVTSTFFTRDGQFY